MASKDQAAPAPAPSTPRGNGKLYDAIAIASAGLAGVAAGSALLIVGELGVPLSALVAKLVAAALIMVHLLMRKSSEMAGLSARIEGLERELRGRRVAEPRQAAQVAAAPLPAPAHDPRPGPQPAAQAAPGRAPAVAEAEAPQQDWEPWPSTAPTRAGEPVAAEEVAELPAEAALVRAEPADPIKARRARVVAAKVSEPVSSVAPESCASQPVAARPGAPNRQPAPAPAAPPPGRAATATAAPIAAELPVVSLPGALAASEPQANPVGDMIGGLAQQLKAGRAEDDAAGGAGLARDVAELEAVLDRMVKAIDEGRVEVHLQPILTLTDQQTVSYEAFARLRDQDGQLIEPALADALAIETGLKRDIDTIALFRAVHVLAGLEARGKLTPLFVNAPVELLSDGDLFREFVDVMKAVKSVAGHLVLEFPQSTAQGFGEVELESLGALSRLGFSISLDRVTSIELDFEPLLARGLGFVKVPAAAFAQGLAAGEGLVTTPDIGPMFEGAGLQLIVTDMTGESELDLVLDGGAVYGQGAIFAEPKPVKADVLSPGEAAA